MVILSYTVNQSLDGNHNAGVTQGETESDPSAYSGTQTNHFIKGIVHPK